MKKALALQRDPRPARPAAVSGSSASTGVLARRRSTLGAGGSTAAPAIVDAGRPLDTGARHDMEAGFGRDFSNIRVHDDARAHDNARSLGARAYAAGDHIVFGSGAYRPDTSPGRALIAHELAHSVQQGGVQMKADGPIPAGADAELEAQADRAALDVTAGRPTPRLTRIDRPAIFRAISDPPAGGKAKTPAAGPPQNLPQGMTVITDDPPGIGTTELVVAVTRFALPLEKGMGPWVQAAYDEAATGGRLVFSPLIEGNKVAAYKEGGEDYKSIWLGNYGFSTTQGLASAFRSAAKTNDEVKTALADKGVASLITGLAKSLKDSKCDIDHIVEKQMGGTSIPSNLQLLTSEKNQASGRETYQELVKLVDEIRAPGMRGKGVRKLQLQIQTATLPPATSDPSFVVETLLRKGAVKGSDELKAKAEGDPVMLSAGGVGETVRVLESGRTPIENMSKRIVPGMRLTAYTRAAARAKSKVDKVEGELDSRAIAKTGSKASVVALTAELAPAGAAVGAGAGGAAAEENEAAAEVRILKLATTGNTKIQFYYPYLSPGTLTSVLLDDKGNLTGKGIINPSIPFLPNLEIKYGPDLLELSVPIPADKLRSPIPGFRFTEGELGLTLFPGFVPKGVLKFEIGPKSKPLILGDVAAKAEGGAFVATGTLKPGTHLPGIKDASGQVEFHSEKGWSGSLKASTSSIPGVSSINVMLGFTSDAGGFKPYGTGELITKIRNADLILKVAWRGGPVRYTGDVTIPKPLPLVDKVKLHGDYEDGLLVLTGEAAIEWRRIKSTMTVTYRRKDPDEGNFSGKARIDIKEEKVEGHLDLNFDEEGRYWGKGSIAYQLTKDIRPTLGAELTKDRRVKISGEVALADIALTREWPKPGGEEIPIIKGLGFKFSVPTPVPAVTAYGEVRGSLSVVYRMGPVMVRGVRFTGELYPLDDDPQIKARLRGTLAIPASGALRGKFGASIGVEVLLGAVGAKGGINAVPELGVKTELGVNVDAAYESGGFSFEADAYARGAMYAKLGVTLSAEIYAAWGLFSHTWEYPVGSVQKQLGPELNITLGKIGYSRTGEITLPKLSDVKVTPEIDPLGVIKELLSEGRSKGREEAVAKLREMGFDVD
jgi:hypothetical protein